MRTVTYTVKKGTVPCFSGLSLFYENTFRFGTVPMRGQSQNFTDDGRRL